MLDRIDMHVHLSRVSVKALQAIKPDGENSATIKQRVTQARIQQHQQRGKLNSQLTVQELQQYCQLDKELQTFLEVVCEKLNMSARAYHRVLKLSRTIADMANDEHITKTHLSEAIAYRSLDRR